MEEDSEPDSRGKSLRFFMAAALGILFYFLSIGPVALAMDKIPLLQSPRVEQIVKGVYYPVIWLDFNTSMQRPIESYLALWGEQ